MGNSDGVFQDRCVDIVFRINVNPPHKLHELPCFSQVVAGCGSYQVSRQQGEGAFPNFLVLQVRES